MPGEWQDPYCYPGTFTLINTAGEHDPDRLAAIEADVTALTTYQVQATRLPGAYDLKHLQVFHRAIFAPLYPWAGELRTVSMAKGDTVFHPPTLLNRGAEYVFGELADDLPTLNRLAGLGDAGRLDFLGRLAVHLGSINELHPFREGNGRAQRAFIGQLARDHGVRLAWERLDRQRNIAASIAAHHDPRASDFAALLADLADPVNPATTGTQGEATPVRLARSAFPVPPSGSRGPAPDAPTDPAKQSAQQRRYRSRGR